MFKLVTVQRLFVRMRPPPAQKLQILKFSTPFRASQYLIFSPPQRTLKAHCRKSVEIFEKFLGREDFAKLSKMLITSLILKRFKKTKFESCFTSHPLQKVIVSQNQRKLCGFLNFYFFKIPGVSAKFASKTTFSTNSMKN